MSILFFFLIVVITAIALGSAAYQYPGTVSIQLSDWNIATSFAFAITALVISFITFYFLLRSLFGLMRMPRRVSRWQEQRKLKTAEKHLHHGQFNLAKGRWKQAEKDFLRSTPYTSQPAMAYIGAAQAAQELGRLESRDRYLQLAHEKTTREQVFVGLTEAQLLIANQQVEKATEILTNLQKIEPKNALLLKLLKDCYVTLHDWDKLALLAPQLEKIGAVSPGEAEHLEEESYLQILARAAAGTKDSRQLDEAWKTIPAILRRRNNLLAAYTRYLIQYGEKGRPEQLLRRKLNKFWDNQLVYLYGFVEGQSLAEQLTAAEKWLIPYPEDATLLLTLGRLSLRNQLWGKARSYLESSASLEPRPETYLLLGKLLEQTGETSTALTLFQRGLGLSVHKHLPESTALTIQSLSAMRIRNP